MTNAPVPRFVILAILDGWGLAAKNPGNAVALADTPNIERLTASYPHTELEASGEAVGLPRGEDGNTETGHLNIGAGMIIYQALERINMAIAEGSFFENKVLTGAIEHCKKNNSDLHLMGLVGAGGVHSNINHLYALIQFAKRKRFNQVFLHLFTDGRDSPPTSAKIYINEIKKAIAKERVGKIASIMGRYWSMDRDNNWPRTEKAYLALTKGQGLLSDSSEQAIDQSYQKGEMDEFIQPTLITQNDGKPLALIKENDGVIFFNFRIDRPRQLSKAFVFDNLDEAAKLSDFDPHGVTYDKTHTKIKPNIEKAFERGPRIKNLYFATMTQYSKPIVKAGAKVAFPPVPVEKPLGKVIAENKIHQLRITESEKERFVTFYFNGLREKPFTNEDRIILPSPAVPTYDQKPEMAANEITETLLAKMADFKYSFVVVNYPNADMVGHTGNIGPTVKAIETVDACIGKLANFTHAYDGVLVITADHGNAEEMINKQTGEIDTEHSTNKVPFIVVSKRLLGNKQTLTQGILADIAPTILTVMGIEVPNHMTGRNLLGDIWN